MSKRKRERHGFLRKARLRSSPQPPPGSSFQIRVSSTSTARCGCPLELRDADRPARHRVPDAVPRNRDREDRRITATAHRACSPSSQAIVRGYGRRWSVATWRMRRGLSFSMPMPTSRSRRSVSLSSRRPWLRVATTANHGRSRIPRTSKRAARPSGSARLPSTESGSHTERHARGVDLSRYPVWMECGSKTVDVALRRRRDPSETPDLGKRDRRGEAGDGSPRRCVMRRATGLRIREDGHPAWLHRRGLGERLRAF